MNRRAALLIVTSLVAGCESNKFKPLHFAQDVVLQDPPPGKAIVYLLRAPHDNATVDVYLGQKKLAVLPPSTYTVVSVDPGIYEIASEPGGGTEAGPISLLTVQAGERRFIYTSIPNSIGVTVDLFFGGPVGVIPIVIPRRFAVGARTWSECRELDAQGLISLSKLVLPLLSAA